MKLFRTGEYLLYEGTNPFSSARADVDNTIRCLNASDALDSQLFGANVQFLPELLGKGVKLFVCFDENYPLGMMCGYSGSCYIRGSGIPLIQSDDTVYWFWIYTLPESRGKNVYTKLKHAFFSFYKDTNHFTALVDPSNAVMCNEMRKIGFKPTKRYKYIKMPAASFFAIKDISTNTLTYTFENGNRHNLLVI